MMSVSLTTSVPDFSGAQAVTAVKSHVITAVSPIDRLQKTDTDTSRHEEQALARRQKDSAQGAQPLRGVRRDNERSRMLQPSRTLRATLEHLRQTISPAPPDGLNEMERKAREAAKHGTMDQDFPPIPVLIDVEA